MNKSPLVVEVGPDGEAYHPWTELQKSGALWFFNAALWYPRGYAMTAVYPDDTFTECVGYKIIGDGKRPWTMPSNLREINEAFRKFKELYP